MIHLVETSTIRIHHRAADEPHQQQSTWLFGAQALAELVRAVRLLICIHLTSGQAGRVRS